MVLHESSSYKKKFQCPYCSFRGERNKLINHIDKKHEDLIPEGYTSTRLVFNIINKKTHGTCTECGKESKWNEQKARYERLCDDPKCHEAYLKKVKGRMVKSYGVDNLLGDIHHQEKMLANRKISGKYKFSDGGERQYTGSYEKKALEFFDNILHVHSDDIITPGPVIEYEFQGKKHMWITDIFYVPYKLVIEVKDGGGNPNNRPMEEYRAKQIAKEKAIVAGKEFNYLRLTDNNFVQLFQIFGQLKMQLVEDNKLDRIVQINENFGDYSGMLPMDTTKKNAYIVNYMQNNVYSTGYSKDFTFDTIFIKDEDGKTVKKPKKFLKDCMIEGLYVKVDPNGEIERRVMSSDTSSIMEAVLGRKQFSHDDFLLEFTRINSAKEYAHAKTITSIIEATIKNINTPSYKEYYNGTLPKNTEIRVDRDGYYLFNKINNLRTASRESMQFSDSEKYIIEKGVL